jgi:hypothetical protein
LFQVVPKDASKLGDFQKIIECTSQFETALKEMMFISASDNKDERLSNFAENVEVHFASRKKKEILGKARKLLLQCDFDIPQVSFLAWYEFTCSYFEMLAFDCELFFPIGVHKERSYAEGQSSYKFL